jgi:hypothetical protein
VQDSLTMGINLSWIADGFRKNSILSITMFHQSPFVQLEIMENIQDEFSLMLSLFLEFSQQAQL